MSQPNPEPPKAILCFDFDGTFVERDLNQVALHDLLTMIDDLRQRGAAWVINTGRSLFQTLEGLTQHGIRQVPDYIVAREGEIYHRSQYNRWIDLGDWNAQRTKDHKKLYKAKDKFFKATKRFLQASTEASWVSEPSDPAGIISSTEEEMNFICEWLAPRLEAHPELHYQRNSIYLRFTHQDYSKGTALRALSDYLSILPDHVFVAGDNHNDLSMLTTEVAHCLACPGNSLPEVKAVVAQQEGYIASGHATAGCVEALRYYFYD
jgi:HAD superfamily hydrolase (TIGR01484 family)